MFNGIREKIIRRLSQLHTILTINGSLKARLKGCYFEMYEMLYFFRIINVEFKTIIDIGANRGMFTKTANYLFPEAKIIAFEPLKSCFEQLTMLQKLIPGLECYNIALSNSEGEEEIFHSAWDYSSSLLEMDLLHKNAFPESADYLKEKVKIATMDDVINIKKYKTPILMKIDVQGYEGYVIEGAKKTLESIDYLICEMSFQSLYKNQILFDNQFNLIIKNGFEFLGPISTNKHPKTKLPLQIDGLFKRIS